VCISTFSQNIVWLHVWQGKVITIAQYRYVRSSAFSFARPQPDPIIHSAQPTIPYRLLPPPLFTHAHSPSISRTLSLSTVLSLTRTWNRLLKHGRLMVGISLILAWDYGRSLWAKLSAAPSAIAEYYGAHCCSVGWTCCLSCGIALAYALSMFEFLVFLRLSEEDGVKR
jgi:hypothetical protein